MLNLAKQVLMLGGTGLLHLLAPGSARQQQPASAVVTTRLPAKASPGKANAKAPKHAYHSTILELSLDPQNQVVQMSLKIFADDLEKAVSNGKPVAVNLQTPMAMPQIERYLHEHLKITIPAARHQPRLPQDVQFKGMQREKDAYFLFAKATLIHPSKELLIRNDILLELYSDQKNIMNATHGDKKASVLFQKGHVEEVVYF